MVEDDTSVSVRPTSPHRDPVPDRIATMSEAKWMWPNIKANANRIVACVNACEGVNPEAIPELLEVLRWAAMFAEGTRDIDRQMNPGRGLDNPKFNEWIDRCNAAIEQATSQEVTP
jgi:hypothetical protein